MSKKLSGQKAPEQVKEWKDKHGKVFTYTTEDDKIGYFKPVDRNIYAHAATQLSKSPAKFTELIVQSCWLGGDEDIINKDEYYFGVVDFTEQLMNKKRGDLGEV